MALPMCPDVITWIGSDGRRHVSINCRSGKNCNHAHSREEILYHPSIYKTVMCETWNCARYYCPFAHSMDELVSKPPGVSDDIRLRQLNFEDFWEDNDFDIFASGPSTSDPLLLPAGSPTLTSAGGPDLQLRRVVPPPGRGMLITSTNLDSSRIGPSCLNSVGVAPNPDDPGWITLLQGLRVELVVRAVSPLTSSELCLGTARAPWENAASANGNASNRRTQQQASMVVKVIRVPGGPSDPLLVALVNQLQTLSRSEHKNILPIKKIHITKTSSTETLLVVAYERCSTSLYTTVADGYRSRLSGGPPVVAPRGLAGRMNPGPLKKAFSPTSAAIGKIGELLAAIQRFHSLGLVHGRICPSNIFVDADAALKLGDCDSRIGVESGVLLESVQVWMGAEILSKKGDVFSAGLCVFLALTGQHPFGTFGDDDRSAAAGAAACASALFVEETNSVLSNMNTNNMVNQHLLYGCPLALDLVFRMILAKTEVGELLTHPLFWDFYAAARFIMRLPLEEEATLEFCASCPVPWTSGVAPEEWKLIGLNATPCDFKDTVADCLGAIRSALAKHKSSGCPMCTSSDNAEENLELAQLQHTAISAFVCRMLARYPAVAVRAWDAGRLAAANKDSPVTPVFKRNHLAWMVPNMPSPAFCSHAFVREYYLGVAVGLGEIEPAEFIPGRDESEDIVAAIERGPGGPTTSANAPDPALIASMVNSFSAMIRSDMLPPGVPKSFVYSLIDAAGSPAAPAASPTNGGVYYSTVPPQLQLPSGATTAATNSPAFVTVMSPKESPTRNRRMSSCDGWEYAVACPPTMLDLRHSSSIGVHPGDDEDESPPPGFQAVWQSMADDGL